MDKTRFWVFFGAALALVVGAVLIFGWHPYRTTPTPAAPPMTATSTNRFTVVSVPNNQWPSGIPTDLPIEKKATILESHQVSDTFAGRYQADRTYATAITATANFTKYEQYMTANHWTVTATLNQPNYKVISGTKNGASLTVVMNYQNPKQNVVSISYSYALPSAPSTSNPTTGAGK